MPKLFPTEEKEKNIEQKESEFVVPAYFYNTPLPLLLIFAWFSYKIICALLSCIESIYILIKQPYLFDSVAFLIPIWFGLTSLFYPLILIPLLWGIVKQKSWTKILMFIWLGLGLVLYMYEILPFLQQIGDFMPYYKPMLSSGDWLVFIDVLVVIVVDFSIAYYLVYKYKILKWKG